MNTPNNKRRRQSVEKIERAFVELLQTRELKDISVTDICNMTELNRSTFYANFLDVYDLADKIRNKLESDFAQQFSGSPDDEIDGGALKMFRHIKENQLFYKTYFKLGYEDKHKIMIHDASRAIIDFDGKHIEYHIEFFRNGLNAIIKMWLNGGCRETPEEMAAILESEYRGR